MRLRLFFSASVLGMTVALSGAAFAAATADDPAAGRRPAQVELAQAQMVTPLPRPTRPPVAKKCRREPIWGFRMSPFCKPTGICSDRVVKGYRTVCS